MKTARPESVVVGPYTLMFVYLTKDNLQNVAKTHDNKDGTPEDAIDGLLDIPNRAIYISNTLYGEQLKDVILHEVLHAIISIFGLDHILSEDEELFVSVLSPALLAVTSQLTWDI